MSQRRWDGVDPGLDFGVYVHVPFCTKRCDRICPDRLDYPTTYCVDAAKVGASDSSDGRCVPVSNDQSHSCRRFAVLAPSAATPRHGQPEVTRDVCLPAE